VDFLVNKYEGRSIIYLPEQERNNLSQKKIFFIFQYSPLITQYTSSSFVATTLSPWKKSFDCSANQVVTASLTSS
jgi:ABC-type lipoprotein export system ATPase subunit